MDDALETTADETAALRNAPEGTRVLGIDGGKLGEVVAVYRDRLIVERGFFFPTDYYVPFAAVGEYTGGTVRLIVSLREALEFGWETPPEDETVPPVAQETPPVSPTSSGHTVPAEPPPATSAPPPEALVAPTGATSRPATAESPAPAAESTGGTAEPEKPTSATTSSPDAVHGAAAIPAVEPEAPAAEEPAPPEPAVPSPDAPAAKRPKLVSPLVAAAGDSTLSRLFPDLVAGSGTETPVPDPAAAASTDATGTADPVPAPGSSESSAPTMAADATVEPPAVAGRPGAAESDGGPVSVRPADDQAAEQPAEGDERKGDPGEG